MEPSSFDYIYPAIRDKMSNIIEKTPKMLPDKSPTRVWRILYLIEAIVTRSPTVLPIFLNDILDKYIPKLFDVFKEPKDNNNYRVLYNQNVNVTKLTYALL